MNQLLSSLCLVAFLLLPIVVLIFRAMRPQRMPWWAAGLIVVLLGWLFIIGTAYFHHADLGAQLRSFEGKSDPPQELLKNWANDAPRVFALFFGWAYALLYSLPLALLYALVQFIKRLVANRRT